MGGVENAYKILVGNSKWKKLIWRSKCKLKDDNNKMDLRNACY